MRTKHLYLTKRTICGEVSLVGLTFKDAKQLAESLTDYINGIEEASARGEGSDGIMKIVVNTEIFDNV